MWRRRKIAWKECVRACFRLKAVGGLEKRSLLHPDPRPCPPSPVGLQGNGVGPVALLRPGLGGDNNGLPAGLQLR